VRAFLEALETGVLAPNSFHIAAMPEFELPLSPSISRPDPSAPAPAHAHQITVDTADASRAATVTGDDASDRSAPRYTRIHPSSGRSPALSGVNVARAEADFASLQRELSRTSQLSRPRSAGATGIDVDVEKAGGLSGSPTTDDDDSELFDLEATLRGSLGDEERAGIKAKRIGVLWRALEVKGVGGVRNFVKTFPMAFVSFFNVYGLARSLLGFGKKGTEVSILKGFRGVAKPGEMVLVLGKPGSGCTTFLKVAANQRFGYTAVNGEVLYGPFDHSTFEKRYRGEAVYNGEDDVHHPTLTVGQTFNFALETKIPGKRPAGLSRSEFKERVIDLLLKMFNIEVSGSRAAILVNCFYFLFLPFCPSRNATRCAALYMFSALSLALT